jgi:hypothetical protein
MNGKIYFNEIKKEICLHQLFSSMMEERYHATTQNRFYPDMSNVNKNITVEAKLISPPT